MDKTAFDRSQSDTMKPYQMVVLALIQIVVIYCLYRALTTRQLQWFVASAGSVTLLMGVAVTFALLPLLKKKE
jgi:hypothetical protein